MITNIKTLNDVKIFIKQLVSEGINAHPDEDFSNYVNMETGEDTYTADEVLLRNKLMKQSIQVCNRYTEDIYSIMQEIFLIESGMDKYIPLPSKRIS